MNRTTPLICASLILVAAACGSDTTTSSDSSSNGVPSTSGASTEPLTQPSFPARLGTSALGYLSVVDLAVRTVDDGNSTTYSVDQGGIIKLVRADGRPGDVMADLTELTDASGEQGLLGLAFSQDGRVAYVNYTDLSGDTTVDSFSVVDDGTFDMASRRTIYTLDQPYPNHNGGDLLLSPDGRSLLVFNGDGGSQGDPERRALDPSSQFGKIVRIDLEASGDDAVSIWAAGLRNPWRSYFDPVTQDLWIADVGQNEWEEINVVPFSRSEGVSFGWSAFEGTQPFNADQADALTQYVEVTPIHTYPHENNDCSISGGAVYHGSAIPVIGTWYVFSDFCSGNVRALCVTESRTSCGIMSLGNVQASVAVLPDASGELWVLSLSGELVPIVAS